MNETTLNNLDGISSYTSNVDETSKSMTIIVQNPFDDPSNSIKYHRDSSSESHTLIGQHSGHYNQIDHFSGISTSLMKQSGTIDHQSTTSLIPIPSPLSHNLGVQHHSITQPSLTPTIIRPYSATYPHYHQTTSTGMYLNNVRPMVSKLSQSIRPSNGTSQTFLRFPSTQQYGHQMIKPRMISPNTYRSSSQTPVIYDPNVAYRPNGQQQVHHVPLDDNILKSLLQINPQINSETSEKPQSTIIKGRKKRKANGINTSNEDDQSSKPRKRKKKGTEETDKFVENSLQQLRELPMLTPIEPIIDLKDDFIIPFSDKKSNYQGLFGNIFIENYHDYYRPNRQISSIIKSKTLSTFERRYRLCSNLLDHPPSLPSPPLMTNIFERINELHNDESIVSNSDGNNDDDDDNDNEFINDIQTENTHLLQTLSSSYDNHQRPLSPLCLTDKFNETTTNDRSFIDNIDKVSVTLTLTTEAANNVQSVIEAVADLLKMAYPKTFDVHQTLNQYICTSNINNLQSKDFLSLSTDSSITYMNRTGSNYKIGRETSINIQTLIDMQPKYCRYCSKNLSLNNLYKKRLNELPVNLRELTSINIEPFVYFCHEQCFTNYIQQSITINMKTESMEITTLTSVPIKRQQQLNDNKHWKRWDSNLSMKIFIPSENIEEINQLIDKIQIPLSKNTIQDQRICIFCNQIGDMTNNGPGRLLNFNVGQWCHLNCALWSSEVYETHCGALMCVDQAFIRSVNIECIVCKQKGSSLSCFYQRCPNKYHFTCAINHGCTFYKNKTIMCPIHAPKTITNDEIMDDKSVLRRVWINRDEIKQIQEYMNDEHDDKSYILRIGSLILHNIGQLLPHQLQSSTFHNRDFIYPVGYTVTRFYWSINHPNRRCAYICSIIDQDNKPMFHIRINENNQNEEYFDCTAKNVWKKIIEKIVHLRQEHQLVKMFPVYITGEDLFGLTEPNIIRLIESLPGVEMLQNYAFKYGRLQLFDMPLTINPTGCARSEPKFCTHFRRHTQTLTSTHSNRNTQTILFGSENNHIPYVKQFVLSKSTQYRKLKTEWRLNIYLAKSRIQGLGLFAARDLEKHTMVIEYIGELIRNEVANHREKFYEQQNRGIYMFRLDDNYVVDATMSGCLARYINHSCEPNAIAEVVQIEKENKIIIITNRRINKGEEIMYDYKFDFEEDSKIPCLCGAVNCRKWMN